MSLAYWLSQRFKDTVELAALSAERKVANSMNSRVLLSANINLDRAFLSKKPSSLLRESGYAHPA